MAIAGIVRTGSYADVLDTTLRCKASKRRDIAERESKRSRLQEDRVVLHLGARASMVVVSLDLLR